MLTLSTVLPRLAATLLLLQPLAGCAAHVGASPPGSSAPHAQNEALVLTEKGRAAMAAGDTVRAEQYLTLAIARGADEQILLKDLLATCVQGSRLRSALDHARSFLQKHPDEHELRYLVASLHVSLSQEVEAREQLELLLKRSPKHADAHYLAGVLDSADATPEAHEHFRTYLELEPLGLHAPEVRGRLSELELRATPRAAGARPRLAKKGGRSAQ